MNKQKGGTMALQVKTHDCMKPVKMLKNFEIKSHEDLFKSKLTFVIKTKVVRVTVYHFHNYRGSVWDGVSDTERGIRLRLPTVKTTKTDKAPSQTGNEGDGPSRLSHISLIIARALPASITRLKTRRQWGHITDGKSPPGRALDRRGGSRTNTQTCC